MIHLQILTDTIQSWRREVNSYVPTRFEFVLMLRSIAIDYLISRFEHQNIAVLYVYFEDFSNQAEVRILTRLLKQCIAQLEVVPDSVRRLYEISISTNTSPDDFELLRQLKSCAASFDTVYLIFDALDECGDQRQRHILHLINELLAQPQLKIMLSSRPHLQRLQTLPEDSHRIVIDPKDVDQDVRTYLSFRLERERFLSPKLKNKIVEVLSQQAEGMYALKYLTIF